MSEPKDYHDIPGTYVFDAEQSRSSRSGGTATKWQALPMSMPAALGGVIVRALGICPV
jgi:hypothetical protein